VLPTLRVLNLHPALAHVPVGAAPLLFAAYAIARWRRSAEWTFAGDALLFLALPFTLIAFAFGLVSNAIAAWPGGLSGWRTAHLVLGAVTSAGYLALAVYRGARRSRTPRAGTGLVVATGLLVAVVGATGWVGGEVLVFHAGIGVQAAANGALAPALPSTTGAGHPPSDLGDAMGQLRGAWGEAQVSLAEMIVQRPTAGGFARIGADAARLEQLATWLDANPPQALSDEDLSALHFMVGTLGQRAHALGDAAARSSLPLVSKQVAAISATCAGCHAQLRWKPHPPGVER
jgi:uncharacterized membrane protein